MTTYEYHCPDCGRFEVRLPIGTAPDTHDCAGCEAPARRVYSPPHLSSVPARLSAALAREEQAREAPDVVTRKAGRRPPRPPHPALGRLPRP